MPYLMPDADKACESCVHLHSEHACADCKCKDPEFMRHGAKFARLDLEHTQWANGYHWEPSEWRCDHCERQDFADLGGPMIDAEYTTICPECAGTILDGLEAMRKAGLSVHVPHLCFQLGPEEETQHAVDFYGQLSMAGKGERDDKP